jgi:transposase
VSAGRASIIPHRPVDWREGRRLRAWELKQQGWTQRASAAAPGVTPGAVSQWMGRARRGGAGARRRRLAPGPTPKLTAGQRARVPALLARGAAAFGFRGAVWTARRVALGLKREFGVRYHPNHLGTLLRAAGWSPPKPIRRATRRDAAAIAAWHAERWPAREKGRPGRADDRPGRRVRLLPAARSRPDRRPARADAAPPPAAEP